MFRNAQLVMAATVIWLVVGQASIAAELIMFRQPGCPYCLTWDRMVGTAYPKSDLGRRAPIRMLDISQATRSQVEFARPVRYTPTFILVDGGREIGRIEGYPGEDFFWGLLEKLVRNLPAQ